MAKQEAVDAFVTMIGEAERLLAAIKEHVVDNHMGTMPEEINWSDAGSAGHVVELLEEIAQFCNLE